jgi:hypothetical protein
MRPCPLSVLWAVRSRGGSGGRPSGGKSGGYRACRRREAEGRRDVGPQAGLVVLDEEQVIALLGDDGRADIALTEQGVPGDDAALDRQDAQQFQRRLVFVGLGIDADLHQDRVDQRGVGGDQVLARHGAVAATA